MFSDALHMAEKFTLPVIFSRRFRRGNVSSGLGTFIIVNEDGWILTADHILAELLKIHESHAAMQNYEEQKRSIESSCVTEKDKKRQIQKLPVSDEWIINQAVLWGGPTGTLSKFHRYPLADLALCKIDGFTHMEEVAFPVFRNPAQEIPVGTSLCRVGHPFHQIKATFDEAGKSFTLAPGTLPIPRFPNDGILTRFVNVMSPDGSQRATYIETSTPGLRGQSGGPILDRFGRVCGIQSQTHSLSLGFSPTIKQGGREITEHQFMHLGWGAHVRECIALMQAHSVKFQISE